MTSAKKSAGKEDRKHTSSASRKQTAALKKAKEVLAPFSYRINRSVNVEAYFPPGNQSRCPICGKKVVTPCRVCSQNLFPENLAKLQIDEQEELTLDIQLTGKELERYREVYENRKKQLPPTEDSRR